MRPTKFISFTFIPVIFTLVILLGILAVNASSLPTQFLLCVAAMALAPTGFELWRFTFNPRDKRYRFFSRGFRGYVFDALNMLLATGLTVVTIFYQHPSSLFCQGRLSAGFPVAFICDATGESPLSSVGKIDWSDLNSLSPLGSLIDVVSYLAVLWVIRFIIKRFLHIPAQHTELSQRRIFRFISKSRQAVYDLVLCHNL